MASAASLLSDYYKSLTDNGIDHETASRLVLDAGAHLHAGTCALSSDLSEDPAHV